MNAWMAFSYSATPSSTSANVLIGLFCAVFISRLRLSRRSSAPWSMCRTRRRQASNPLSLVALLKIVSADPEMRLLRKPHNWAFALSTC